MLFLKAEATLLSTLDSSFLLSPLAVVPTEYQVIFITFLFFSFFIFLNSEQNTYWSSSVCIFSGVIVVVNYILRIGAVELQETLTS